jgi:ribosomal protein L11 methyltransferase
MIDVGIRLVSYLQPLPPMNEREVDETEWRNQRFEPTRIGRRLVIVPPGEAYAKRPRDIVIPLEPGLAFGTGHHPTTRMCLTALDRAVRKGDSVLDVGCGTAVLSIAALKLGAARAICLDIDGDAVRAALANLARAGVIDRAAVAQGGLPHEFAPEHGFDIVCANISANIIISLAGHLMATLCEGGLLIVSGILEGRGAEVEAALLGAGGAVTATGQSGEWLVHEVRHATWHERLAEELVRGREPLGGLQGRPT